MQEIRRAAYQNKTIGKGKKISGQNTINLLKFYRGLAVRLFFGGIQMAKRTILKTWLVISIFLVVLGGPATAAGRTIYVDDDATGANNGSSWADAYNFLQEALLYDAYTGAKPVEVRVAQGIYKPDKWGNGFPPGSRMASFRLINGASLMGGYAGFGQPDPNARDIDLYQSILSGDLNGDDAAIADPCDLLSHPSRVENSYHVVEYQMEGTTVLNGFTITGGNANYGTNEDRWGGGMLILEGAPLVVNCTFTQNAAYLVGGAMFMPRSGTIANCIFSYNWATYGGAISYDAGSRATVSNCTFVGNSAKIGGGAYLLLFVPSHGVTPDRLIPNMLSEHSYGNVLIANCIFRDNTDQKGIRGSAQIALYGGGADTVSYSCIQGWPQGGIGDISTDPCFADPNNGDYHLKSQAGRWDANERRWTKDNVTSPCIDAGDPGSPIGYEPFPNGGIINMGAYGGTVKASKSYFGEPVCETPVAGDINGDCKVDFADFAIMVAHWLEDNTPTGAVTTTYLFQPDPDALITGGGTYSIEGQFKLTVDFNAGIASFDQVDATLSGEVWFCDFSARYPILTDSLDVLFHMTELVSTSISDTQIDFVFEKDITTFPSADVHMRVTFLRDDSVRLIGGFREPAYDGFGYSLHTVAVPERVTGVKNNP